MRMAGALGIDVYENEGGIFFTDQSSLTDTQVCCLCLLLAASGCF